MTIRFGWLVFFLLSGVTAVYAGNGWNEVRSPLPGPPEAIGSINAGCIIGAMPLPLVGHGYQVMRSSRNRFYGHPLLVRFLERLGQDAAAHGSRLLIGDLGQPRGGPLLSGHRSHQSGLDVDIWFLQQARGQVLSRSETERLGAPSMIRATLGTLDHSSWSPDYRDTLKQAALAPEVDRVFVNAIIKQALCESETNRSWLNKVRPWWGHEEHLHVRLACPPDSPQCQPQKPIPPGDGCDSDLANWVRDIVQAARNPKAQKRPKPPSTENLPAACYQVLNGGMAQRYGQAPAGESTFPVRSNRNDAELMQ